MKGGVDCSGPEGTPGEMGGVSSRAQKDGE